MAGVEDEGGLAALGDEVVAGGFVAIELDLYFAVVPVFDHVLDDVGLALEVLEPSELFVVFVLEGEVLSEFVDEFAVGPVVVLGADVALDEHVDLDGRVH